MADMIRNLRRHIRQRQGMIDADRKYVATVMTADCRVGPESRQANNHTSPHHSQKEVAAHTALVGTYTSAQVRQKLLHKHRRLHGMQNAASDVYHPAKR